MLTYFSAPRASSQKVHVALTVKYPFFLGELWVRYRVNPHHTSMGTILTWRSAVFVLHTR